MNGMPQFKYILPISEQYATIKVYLTNFWTVCRNSSISYQFMIGIAQFKYILPLINGMHQFMYISLIDERYATIKVYLSNWWKVYHS